jgi:peptidoglycan/xylan/chitin deacetylase (PgdA/CDA1 family)
VSSFFHSPATSFAGWRDANGSPDPGLPSEGALKRGSKALIFGAYKWLGVMRLQEAWRARTRPPFMTIILFHRVTDLVPQDGLTVGTRLFRDFCRLMKSRYHVVRLGEINRVLRSGEAPPRRTVAITFDDCYADNLAAARVLHEHGLPATFFIPTQFVETAIRFPWDSHLPPMPNLTWKDVRQMADWGHDIGSHSVSHADFGKLDDSEALKELAESRAVLEDRVGRAVTWFAFPFGGRANFRVEQIPLVARAGYEGCVSAIGGPIEMAMRGQVLPREAVPPFRNLPQFELHINRCLDWLYRLKRRFRSASASPHQPLHQPDASARGVPR